MAEYKSIKNEKLEGKTVVVRADLNSNVEDGVLFKSARIEKHAATLKMLSEKGAKVVALAHQGRKGEADFISLQQHAETLTEIIGKEVKLVPWESDYISAITGMQPGDITLMENVRQHDNEEQDFSPEDAAKIDWVAKIASVSQLFVQDALSVCHRSQPSVIGFNVLLPSFVGPVLEEELNALKRFDKGEKPCVFVLGGAKIKDSVSMMKELLGKQKADKICVAGLLGEIFLKAKGVSLGAKDAFIAEKGLDELVEPAKQLLESYSEKIILPVDVAIMDDSDEREEVLVSELPKDNLIFDIGPETVSEFKAAMKGAKLIVMNGPPGMFEKMDFEIGTKKIFDAISKSKAFSMLGGGDTEAALEQTDFTEGKFSHVSLAGKAFLQYLSGKELPGLAALKK